MFAHKEIPLKKAVIHRFLPLSSKVYGTMQDWALYLTAIILPPMNSTVSQVELTSEIDHSDCVILYIVIYVYIMTHIHHVYLFSDQFYTFQSYTFQHHE